MARWRRPAGSWPGAIGFAARSPCWWRRVRSLQDKPPDATPQKIADRIARIQTEAGPEANIDEKEALKRLARELGQSKSELYRELQRERARRR